jgi:hypothetical protein
MNNCAAINNNILLFFFGLAIWFLVQWTMWFSFVLSFLSFFFFSFFSNLIANYYRCFCYCYCSYYYNFYCGFLLFLAPFVFTLWLPQCMCMCVWVWVCKHNISSTHWTRKAWSWKREMKEKNRIMGLNACALACFEISVRLAKYGF